MTRRLLRPRIEFEPRDFWVGVRVGEWTQATVRGVPSMLHDDLPIRICPLPCLAVVLTIRSGRA